MSASGYCDKLMAKACIAELLEHGFFLTVDDGEEMTLLHSRDAAAIFGAMFTTDEDYLRVAPAVGADHIGWVRFVYGNDGWDVIADYTTNLEPFLEKTNRFARDIDDRAGVSIAGRRVRGRAASRCPGRGIKPRRL